MKNVLSYYYNLYSENIRLNGENYYFTNNNYYYVFYLYNGDDKNLNRIYEIYQQIIKMGIYSHQIIFNKDGQITTQYGNKKYILFRTSSELTEKVKIQDIINFGNITNFFEEGNLWKQLWSNKVDYFEYQITQVGKKYPLIRESFSYYIGVVEAGICLLNNSKKLRCSVAHKRITKNEDLFEFYNPTNYILDTRVRDLSEYFKNKLFETDDIFIEIKDYLENSNLTQDEVYYFFIRMFYPTFYFDCYEKIIDQDLEEYKIKEVIEITPRYEMMLKKLYMYIKNFIEIPEIEWLNRI